LILKHSISADGNGGCPLNRFSSGHQGTEGAGSLLGGPPLSSQFPVTMSDHYLSVRSKVVKWILEVCRHFSFDRLTSHAAVHYFDRLQPNSSTTREGWIVDTVCCIAIASKYFEREDKQVKYSELFEIAQGQVGSRTGERGGGGAFKSKHTEHTRINVRDRELSVLQRLQWNLDANVPLKFLLYHTIYRGGILKSDDVIQARSSKPLQEAGEEKSRLLVMEAIVQRAHILCDHCIASNKYLRYFASDIGKAVIYVARRETQELQSPIWSSTIRTDVGSIDNACIADIIAQLQDDFRGEKREATIEAPDSLSASVGAPYQPKIAIDLLTTVGRGNSVAAAVSHISEHAHAHMHTGTGVAPTGAPALALAQWAHLARVGAR
jgi:hypothetical protein